MNMYMAADLSKHYEAGYVTVIKLSLLFSPQLLGNSLYDQNGNGACLILRMHAMVSGIDNLVEHLEILFFIGSCMGR